jgi:hypothetical protein
MQGCKKQKTTTYADADAASIAQLPSDVLAVILLCLPASDLRRCRRVCKEWRDIISDQSFINAHQVHGPRAPTHTIVFYPGRRSADGAHESLNGGGFLSSPLDSTGLETWGSPGAGRWITVYANAGHAFAVIAGLRLDTSAASVTRSNTRRFKKALERGPRWRPTMRSPRGFRARHPLGF